MSQYSWSSPRQLEPSKNNLNAKTKCHINHFIAPEIAYSKKNTQTWHTEALAEYKTNAKKNQLIWTYGLRDIAGQSSGQNI